jgi:hypothetical protein
MIVAIIALVCALTGTAWAALGKNSVGSKQLKKNAVITSKIKKEAVTGGKVKKDTLTGTQINEEKLGTVPSAQLANSIPPAEATHLVGAPGEPAFEGGSSNFGSASGITTQPAGFYKDHEGIVHLQGLVKVGSTGPIGKMFTLPAGFRPATGTLLFFNTFCSGVECADEEAETSPLLVGGSNVNLLATDLSGGVITTQETAVSLNGITFRAES